MAQTIGSGNQRREMTPQEKGKYHGTDFESLLESVDANQSFTDLDEVGRAHLLGLLQGIELVKTMKLANWNLDAPFFDFDK